MPVESDHFAKSHRDAFWSQKFREEPRVGKRMVCVKKKFKNVSRRPYRRLSKVNGVGRVGAQKTGVGPGSLEL